MNFLKTTLSLTLSAVFLVGCASRVDLSDKKADVTTATPKDADPYAGQSGGAGGNAVASVDLTKNQRSHDATLQRLVYFDFDSYVVKDDYRDVVEAHARVLSTDRNKRVSIEGHTDERGGREYNLALGQRRAEAVQRALSLLGASDKQMEAVSFGKERAAVSGSDEAAWAQNRRAELKLR
jgi:peptidoglycan-associated lipoprotein